MDDNVLINAENDRRQINKNNLQEGYAICNVHVPSFLSFFFFTEKN